MSLIPSCHERDLIGWGNCDKSLDVDLDPDGAAEEP